jgi:hypothetical protein
MGALSGKINGRVDEERNLSERFVVRDQQIGE